MTRAFAGYAITETLSLGAEAILYRALRESDQRPVLIRALAAGEPSVRAAARLLHESELTGLLDLPTVVRAFVHDPSGDAPWIVLEDFGAITLERLLAGPMSVDEFLPWAIRAASALADVHARGVIHRDLCPRNLLLEPGSGTLKLTGFGLASRLEREQPSPGDPRLIAGTLAYISPEQTGRMNRTVDSRSDLYSLGVTFYEMLAGRRPFESSDALGWVHHHIARAPRPLHEVAAVPRPLSAIVLRLLEKMAEDRYQSANGLRLDLERCLREWEQHGSVTPFALGEGDVSDQFRLPQQLYGREAEVETLVRAFERVVACRTRALVVVAGYSGIGKTALVQELYRPIIRTRGYFLSGKFDQYKRGVPYAIITQAFGDLLRQVLTESEERVAAWRARLLAALGDGAQLVTEVVPPLERLIGKPPPVPEVPLSEAQNRFHFTFQRFVEVFAQPDHPLVVFLDDLQWVDAGSLQLLEHLSTHEQSRYLLFVGAYRDNEVSKIHPLARTLDAIEAAGVTVERLALGPLTAAHFEGMLSAATHSAGERVRPLAELVQAKTGGNPFFALQLLTTLHREGLIVFDHGARTWRWELGAIEARSYTDNVVDLVAGRLSRLPDETRRVLKVAAAVGNRVDLATLAALGGDSEAETRRLLWEALREGLVVAHSETEFAFLHDRVQQASYLLLAPGERPALHLEIAGRLLACESDPERSERLFEILEHFDAGRGLLRDEAQRRAVGLLYLRAAGRATRGAAYADAARLASSARELLASITWSADYELQRRLVFTLAETAFLNGDLVSSQAQILAALPHVRTPIEKAEFYDLLIVGRTLEGDYRSAVDTGLAALATLGLDLSAEDPERAFLETVAEIDAQMGDRPPSALLELPRLTDPTYQAAQRILLDLEVASYIGVVELYPLIVARMAKISITHGNSTESCKNYGIYGLALGDAFGRYEQGYQFAELGKALIDRLGAGTMTCKVHWPFTVAKSWVRPLRTTFGAWQDGIQAGLTSGDIQFTAYLHSTEATYHYIAGDALVHLDARIGRGQSVARGLANRWATETLEALRLAVDGLRTDDGRSGPRPAEAAFLADCATHDADSALCLHHCYRAQRALFEGRFEDALAHASRAQPLTRKILFVMVCVDASFYEALALAGLLASDALAPASEERRARLAALRDRLLGWRRACVENCAHKHLLVEAEVARLEGRDLEAMRAYEAAITSARDQGFVQDEGLGHEVAARFYAAQGFAEFAHTRLRDARECYRRWGALGLVRSLELRHPLTFESAVDRSPSPAVTDRLDVISVVKATQAISSKIVLSDLLDTLVPLVIENAGAQRGVLLRSRGDLLTVAAEAETGQSGVRRTAFPPLAETTTLPLSLIHYVRRTHEAVILDDGSREHLFSADPYFVLARPRSVLAIPIVRQATLTGILYLENNLATHVFSSERVALVGLLAGQAAVSLENASLYSDLEKLTEELRRSQRLEAIGRLAGGVAHDFNNLLSVITLCATALGRSGSNVPELARDILQTSERGAELTRQLLAFSRRQVLNPQRLDLGRVIAGLDRILGRLLSSDITLDLRLRQNLARVHADPGQIEQVLVNLVVNARDAMPQGGRLVIETDHVVLDETYTRFHPNVAAGPHVMLAVTDTGLGMDAETRLRIFEPFFTTKEPGKGTGLGLATVYGIIQQSGGHIAVESEPGKGTTFKVFLPSVVDPERADEPGAPASSSGEPLRSVLVVEEDSMVRSFLRRSLERMGHHVVEAIDGDEALALGERAFAHLDLLVTNIVHPRSSGRELARRIAERWPDVRVLYTSSYEQETVHRHGVLAECTSVLRMPFTEEALGRAVRAALEAQVRGHADHAGEGIPVADGGRRNSPLLG